jgi:muramoyltetrapeptide carboxypeptidase
VLGGCLSLLTAVLGTPWATALDDALLFLEDVNEPIYRIDRMLTHLRLSGSLARVRGILAGHFGGDWEQAVANGTAASWHRETLLALPGPVALGLPCGHGTPNLTLPLGAHGRLDPIRGLLEVAAPR